MFPHREVVLCVHILHDMHAKLCAFSLVRDGSVFSSFGPFIGRGGATVGPWLAPWGHGGATVWRPGGLPVVIRVLVLRPPNGPRWGAGGVPAVSRW